MTVIQGINFGSISLQNLDDLEILELNNSMQWADRHQSNNVAGNVQRTLGGGIVTFRAAQTNGHLITLTATEQTGWLRWEEVSKLLTWSDIVDPLVRFRFTFFGEQHDCLFAHFSGPAVSFRQLQSRQDATGGWFTGTLKLYTV